MLGLLTLLAVGLLIVETAVVWQTVRTLTRPPRRTYAWALARGVPGDPSELPTPLPFESWTFRSRGRDLPVWEVAGNAPSGPVIVCSHGWGESRHAVFERLPALRPLASRIVAWDLPGHGDAPGSCRLGTSETADLGALVAHLREHSADARIVLHGWSLGAGVSIAAAAATSDAVAGVIAESPYRRAVTPAQRVLGLMHLPWRANLRPAMWLLGVAFGVGPRWRGFDRATHAAAVRCPLLVLHGDTDEVCPFANGVSIARAAPRGTLVTIPGGHHRDLWTEPAFAEKASGAVREFVRTLPRC